MTMNFGNMTLGGAMATFGGQSNPMCNYTSPLAKKFVYKEVGKVYYPLRRHVFRTKVRTAAEIRFNEVVKNYMKDKMTFKRGCYAATITNTVELDHMGSIIPKDEYEVKRLTSYMTSKKMSNDYKKHMQELWTRVLFVCESTNLVGVTENAMTQNSRPGTDEEFMSLIWYSSFSTTLFAFVVTLAIWWYRYGQAPQYAEFK
ncbi:putative mitochondrial hypothetical protein [Leptomonas pyrrhocoris]|uniref:Uncharacterized protein n=1 Tax=Leptomonas pyrrhocoris TaxID=157538 RepID=A0A0M9FT58_LEPPY|nr:putative mitochondrial hypothetical protein [Leptomonas pyrrhocoris]XP_015653984.1 putative mitochondrial hypothetical protein [Leptomonas pyrrhocoris]KPA75544.1 putative mitochondrial hypothetical protein [Leptomonas pyrrhocoris]KPA75545.1 putative mitochondrial hypothetical protein [Leptomonas pyrrhocoris]|eukprot:XP_015653983.1 putative mitochondrial hypothetical protein [Leptomonas pyrrhocoris]